MEAKGLAMAVQGYTTKARILDIEPALNDISDLSAAHIDVFITDAEAEIDARLAKQYTPPLTGIPYITAIATDIAIYRILSRRVFTQGQLKDSVWPDRFKEALEQLKEIAEGTVELVDSSGTVVTGRTDVVELWTNNQNYQPTFHEGSIATHSADNIQDEDKVDDLLDARDL
jgi:phage gp36-like protein